MPNRKRRHAGSDSSSSPPSVEGAFTWSGKKGRRLARRVGTPEMQMEDRGKDVMESGKQTEDQEMKEEMKKEMKELRNQVEEQGKQMKEMKKGMKEMKKQNKQLRNQVDEQGKQIKKLKKGMKALKQKPTCLSSGEPPPPESVQEGNTKLLKLLIEMKVSQPVYTNNNLVRDLGNRIRISLIDAENGQTITSGMESSIKVHVVVLGGNFNSDDHEFWRPEEFDRSIIKGRAHKQQLLIGDLQVTLKKGVGFINKLRFMDNSRWIPDGKFRIGAHVDSGYFKGTRICEAFSDPFVVREKRGESNEKHYPPQSSDPVWRLEGIGKGGPFHKKLNANGITSVEEFLQVYNRRPDKLREFLGGRMTPASWMSLIEHAKTCPSNVHDDVRNDVLPFDNVASLTGFVRNGVSQPIDSLSDSEKQVVELDKAAHQNCEPAEYAGINPHHDAVARSPGNHDGIPVGPSNAQNLPTQISLHDHPESSAVRSQGLSSVPDAVTNSGVAAEQARTSQQIFFEALETPMSPLFAWCGSSSHDFPNSDNDDCFDADELLDDLEHRDK